MSDITLINDSEQSSLVTNGLAKNGELYLKKEGSTDAGSIVVYDSGAWRTFADESSPAFTNTYSINFDGSNDYLEVGNVSGLTGTSFSISAWFYLTANPSGEGIFGAGNSSNNRIWLQVLDSNTIRFGSLGNVNTFDLPSGTFSLNTWYHVVGVINGTSKEVFIDSSSLGTTTVSSLSGTNGINTRIGSLPSQTGAFGALNAYQGILDEVAVFNTALSSSDISSIYNSGTPDTLSSYSPVGWWRMGDNDGGTGTTVTDQGSGSNDGTLTNGPTFSTTIPS